MFDYFVRLGVLAEIRRARALTPISRGKRVVIRSPRGIEIGEVLSASSNDQSGAGGDFEGESPGGGNGAGDNGSRGDRAEPGRAAGEAEARPAAFRILRPMTPDDERLVQRLDRYKREAVELCRDRMRQSGSRATLLDVDQLLDGGTLVMHFLGEADVVAEAIAAEVAKHYESVVRTNHLSELLRDGCGPECGTGGGCGDEASGGCAGCTGCAP